MIRDRHETKDPRDKSLLAPVVISSTRKQANVAHIAPDFTKQATDYGVKILSHISDDVFEHRPQWLLLKGVDTLGRVFSADSIAKMEKIFPSISRFERY